MGSSKTPLENEFYGERDLSLPNTMCNDDIGI